MAQVYLSQYSKRAALADTSTSALNAATASYISPIKLDPVQDPDPTGLLQPSSTYLFQSSSNTLSGYDLYFRQDGNLVKWKWIEGMLNTGLLYGGVLSYSASSFLITPGSGIIVNHNAVTGSEISPMMEYVTWGPITQSIENIATYQNTFVYIDSNGSASQQNVFFTPEQYQIYIPIGRVSHYNNVVANNTYENVQTSYDADGQQNIFVRAFGPLKLIGVATSGQTSTLRLNIGSGRVFNLGGYYPYNPEIPSTYDMSTYNTASIIRIYRSGSGYKFDNNGGSYYTTINPSNYDDGTGILASVSSSEWTIQRVMVNPITGRAHVYYGQNKYNTYDDAAGSISSDAFVESDATANSYPLSAYLVVKGNTTDLTNTVENKIVQAGLFRSVAGGGATGGGGIPGGQNTQIQFNNAGVFDGEPEFTFNYLTNTLTLTGSMLVSGAISASFGPSTVGFFGTSSWAVSASQAISASRAVTASFAISSSRAVTASFALTSSFAVSSSYASSSHNFANTDLVFTGNRKHDTNRYSYFIYSDLVGGNETDPFDGFGVSGSFYFFNSSSNALGTAAGSTNTYTYIEITSQSIDLSFDANPAVPSSYTFTKNSASFSSSLTVTKSVYFPGLTTSPQSNIVIIDTASGQLYYTASNAIGGAANIGILNEGSSITPSVTSIDFVGAGVTATAIGNAVTVTIPGGGGTPGGQNTQIQFNSGSSFSGSSYFTFNYNSQSLQQGYNVVSSGSYQTVIGKDNLPSTSQSAFIIGDGGTGLVFNPNQLAVNVTLGQQNGIRVSTSSIDVPGVFIPSSYFVGGNITFLSASVSETITITTATNNGTTRYEFDLSSPTSKAYNRFETTLVITGGPNAKHNLLFASQSWFELDARDVFIKQLSPSTPSHIIGYNTSSGQLSYATIFPYSGSAVITGSLIVTDGTYDIINTTSYTLRDGSDNRSIIWSERILKDSNGGTNLDWSTANQITITGDLLPGQPITNNTSSWSLGSPTAAWEDLYVSNNSLHLVSGSTSASIQFNNGAVTFAGAAVTLPSSSTVPTASYVTPYEGAWTSYTPTWTAASSNPSINNGTLEGWYKVIGKTCFVRGNIVMGSTTTFGSGEWYVSMPFTASHADAILMTANLLDNGSAWYNATVNGARAGFNYKAPIQFQTSSGTANDVNATNPFTWAPNDRFLWNGSYEIA